jgi:hypothetical protein
MPQRVADRLDALPGLAADLDGIVHSVLFLKQDDGINRITGNNNAKDPTVSGQASREQVCSRLTG